MYLRLEKLEGGYFLMNMDHVITIEPRGETGRDAIQSRIFHMPVIKGEDGIERLSETIVAVPFDRIRSQVADIWENDSH